MDAWVKSELNIKTNRLHLPSHPAEEHRNTDRAAATESPTLYRTDGWSIRHSLRIQSAGRVKTRKTFLNQEDSDVNVPRVQGLIPGFLFSFSNNHLNIHLNTFFSNSTRKSNMNSVQHGVKMKVFLSVGKKKIKPHFIWLQGNELK